MWQTKCLSNHQKERKNRKKTNGLKRHSIWHVSLIRASNCLNYTFQHQQICHLLNEWEKKATDVLVCLSGAAAAQEHCTPGSSPRQRGEVMSSLVADGWRAPPLWLPGSAKHKHGLLLWPLQDILTAPRFILKTSWRRWMNVSLSRARPTAHFRKRKKSLGS